LSPQQLKQVFKPVEISRYIKDHPPGAMVILTRFAAFLSLCLAAAAFVVFPEAEVFQTAAQDSLSSALSSDKAPVAFSGALEQVIVDDEWVKITRLPIPQTTINSYDDDADDQPLPVIIWHGLGDSADAKGLKGVAELLDEVHPGTYTYLISLTGGPGSADRQASFFGNVTQQIDTVCDALAKDNILRTAPAVDGIGFSQGGLFLRGYIERCSGAGPKVRSLITFGSPHNGIAEFQKCKSATDWVCQGANTLLKSSTVWSDFIQSRLVPAQYYRDTKDFDNYLEHSNYLADINNERVLKNVSYAANLASLEQFVMVMFDDDTTLIPKWTAWFAEFNETDSSLTMLADRQIYKEDWVGLKKLGEQDRLKFVKVKGEHMQFSDKDLRKLFGQYFGPEGRTFEPSKAVRVPSEQPAWRSWQPATKAGGELK
jgi:palmitoyl-protein thioesterase